MIIGFISAGFNPPDSLTAEETLFLKSSKYILVDAYTSPNFMGKFEDKEVITLERERLENYNWIFNLDGDVSIVSSGDIFSATTHFNIYSEAVRRGVMVKVFHNASIFPTAATRIGLHVYKIGPPVSLPRFTDAFRPYSPYCKVIRNIREGLHTIILLDTNPPMRLKEALDELYEMEKAKGGNVIVEEKEIVIISNLGRKGEIILFGKIKDLYSYDPEPPITIVIPSELHFTEMENLGLFRINK